MSTAHDPFWVPLSLDSALPVYQAVAGAIEGDISSGRLAFGAKLPPQRMLADHIGVDFTTITRAYAEARKRGLIRARVGQGTFVCGHKQQTITHPHSKEIDMGMNTPPTPNTPALLDRMRHEMAQTIQAMSPQTLFSYQNFIGSDEERIQAAHWVSKRLKNVHPDHLLICPGTQSTLLALLTHFNEPGMVLCSEELTYPGFKSLVKQMGITHIGLEMDEDGILPSAFEQACQDHDIRLLYCTPTQHNPTTITWSNERRSAIASIAREYDVQIIEDDAYGILTQGAPAPLSDFAPERAFYISGLSKCVSSALRIAFLHVPKRSDFQSLSLSLRSTALMASALTKAMALKLISSGTAHKISREIAKESAARQKIARAALPHATFASDPSGFHIWLTLPKTWPSHEFIPKLRSHGIRIVGADVFCVNPKIPNAVRICLGVPETRERTKSVFDQIAQVLNSEPDFNTAIV